ncbi:MAG: alpha/beta fold hydrolase [Burkholderiales bacterium]
MSAFFPGFERAQIKVSGASINLVRGGQGPALLLLHGYPQTHWIWHKIAPPLAEKYTVVATDLRGYGDSSKPAGLPDHSNYSKRALALDQVEVMQALGYKAFHLVGHDRGARVAHRLALGHPQRVKKLAVLDICPTKTMARAGELSRLRRRPKTVTNAVAFPSRFINNTFEGRFRSDYGNIWKNI